jgi:hypothetical protein
MFLHPQLLTSFNFVTFLTVDILFTVILVKALENLDCSEYSKPTTPAGQVLFYICLSIGLASVAFTVLVRVARENEKKFWSRVLVFSWILLWISTVVGAEINMAIYEFIGEDGVDEKLTASTWGLGQVMAVVMLASQLLEIWSYFQQLWGVKPMILRLRMVKQLRGLLGNDLCIVERSPDDTAPRGDIEGNARNLTTQRNETHNVIEQNAENDQEIGMRGAESAHENSSSAISTPEVKTYKDTSIHTSLSLEKRGVMTQTEDSDQK